MVELDCMMYLININLKLIKLYLNNINKVILSYLLGILLVLWYVEMSWGNLLAIHTQAKHTQYLLMVIFDFMTHSMKINLIRFKNIIKMIE